MKIVEPIHQRSASPSRKRDYGLISVKQGRRTRHSFPAMACFHTAVCHPCQIVLNHVYNMYLPAMQHHRYYEARKLDECTFSRASIICCRILELQKFQSNYRVEQHDYSCSQTERKARNWVLASNALKSWALVSAGAKHAKHAKQADEASWGEEFEQEPLHVLCKQHSQLATALLLQFRSAPFTVEARQCKVKTLLNCACKSLNTFKQGLNAWTICCCSA